jgi:hypothetical protein
MPAYYLSPTEKLLHKGLKGAWHYKTDNSGKAVSNIPEKDEISHVCEAWANGVCVMLPANVVQDVSSLRQAAGRARKRAQTYAVGG